METNTTMNSCPQCDYTNKYKKSLTHHIVNKHGKVALAKYNLNLNPSLAKCITIHSCPTCSYETTNKWNFARHISKHIGDTPYSSINCDYKATDFSSFKEHKAEHQGEESLSEVVYSLKPHQSYTCALCEYTATTELQIRNHLNDTHPNRSIHTSSKYKCALCLYDTEFEESLMIHLRSHCNRSEDRNKKTENIMDCKKPVVVPKTKYACILCSFTAVQGELKSHFFKTHLNNNPYFCLFCGYRTDKGSDLNLHALSHSEKKYHSYDHKTSKEEESKKRSNKHKDECYECVECDYQTGKASSIIRHIQKHNEEMYSCNDCDFKTKYSYNLTRHLQIHSM